MKIKANLGLIVDHLENELIPKSFNSTISKCNSKEHDNVLTDFYYEKISFEDELESEFIRFSTQIYSSKCEVEYDDHLFYGTILIDYHFLDDRIEVHSNIDGESNSTFNTNFEKLVSSIIESKELHKIFSQESSEIVRLIDEIKENRRGNLFSNHKFDKLYELQKWLSNNVYSFVPGLVQMSSYEYNIKRRLGKPFEKNVLIYLDEVGPTFENCGTNDIQISLEFKDRSSKYEEQKWMVISLDDNLRIWDISYYTWEGGFENQYHVLEEKLRDAVHAIQSIINEEIPRQRLEQDRIRRTQKINRVFNN